MIVVSPAVLDQVRSAYEGQDVLVTGGASFISSHLVEALVEMGAAVTVADDLSSGKLENLSEVRDQIRVQIGDLRDPIVAAQACQGQDVVFHLAAAHGGRGYIETHPVECLNNMALDHTVFSAAVHGGASKVVHASSACAYPTDLQDSTEDRRQLAEDMAGFDRPGQAFADGGYGWAKLMGEFQLAAFVEQYGIGGAACRIFTAYGERENESHAAVALIAKAVARLDPYPIWGDGSQTRNFTYVADTAAGLLLAGTSAGPTTFDVFNVGTSTHHTIDELIQTIFQVLEWWPSKIDRQLDMPVGVLSRAADCSKVLEAWGWSPEVSLSCGIERTTRWYQTTADADRLASLDAVLMAR
jgi:UDP-glucose 4-epimerase